MCLPMRPLPRPKFAQWRFDRDLTCRATAALVSERAQSLGKPVTCSPEMVRLLCLPFADRRRRLPSPDMAGVIESVTDGLVGEFDWHAPARLRSAA